MARHGWRPRRRRERGIDGGSAVRSWAVLRDDRTSEGGETSVKMHGATVVPQLLSVQELSELLQVPVGTIYQWRFRREGPPSIRVGRFLRFDPADVRRWLDERRAATAEIPR